MVIPSLTRPSMLPLLATVVLIAPTAAAETALEPMRRLTPEVCRQVDRLVTEALADGKMAGAVVVFADSEQIHFAHAYGNRQTQPAPRPMTLDTLFDLASLTKPIATACSVMQLVEQGKVDLDTPVAEYLPEFGANGKESVTVTDLLLHQGGLIPDNALADYDEGPQVAWEKICRLSLRQPPGEAFVYTDVGFVVLGELVERVSGLPLDRFARQQLFEPLGMNATGFNPAPPLARRAAATERREDRWMIGEVHDPRAYRLGGVAGHAGLFSTPGDLVRFGRMLLGQGSLDGVEIFRPETVETMTTPRETSRGLRTLGWDARSPYSSNRGEAFSDEAFGHGGFTGTVLWVDAARDELFLFLSTRLHPDGNGSVNRLAGEIATLFDGAPDGSVADAP